MVAEPSNESNERPPGGRASNTRRAWTNSDVALLRRLAARNTPPAIIALKLGRSEGATYAKASALGVALRKPATGPSRRGGRKG